MFKFTYENTNVGNKEDFEKASRNIARKVLQNHFDLLDEIVITSDMETSLKVRLKTNDFKKWYQEKMFGRYPTMAKIIRCPNNEGHYTILFLTHEDFINSAFPFIFHELVHLHWYIRKDRYMNANNFQGIKKEKLDTFFHVISEYDACSFQVSALTEKDTVPDFNIENETREIINTYKKYYPKCDNDFQRAMNVAMGEFNSILVRKLGYMDGSKKNKLFDDEISTGITYEMFGPLLLEIANLIRKAVDSKENEWEKIAEELYELLSSKEVDYLNHNIKPVS